MAHKEKLKTLRRPLKRKPDYISIFIPLMVFLVAIAIVLYAGILRPRNEEVKNVSMSSEKKKEITQVRQYSDLHITEKAKLTDPNYKSITFSNRTSLLGNAISSFKDSGKINNETENGSWLWTPILQITPEYRDKIISDSKKHGIKNLYLSIDSYLDIFVMPEGKEKMSKQDEFYKILSDFIIRANQNGITVDAEAGWRNWAEPSNTYKAFVTLNFAIEFNKIHKVGFRGFQYDIEPYLLDYYKEDTKQVLGNFINLIDESVARLDGTNLRLSVVVPEFYDHTYIETPKIFYAGQTLYPFEQLLRVLDKRLGSTILIMAYRNFTQGENGSIDVSKDEITVANKYKTKVVLALETGEVEPPYITFYSLSKSYFNKEKVALQNYFQKDQSYGGMATHYINSLIELN